MKTVTGNSDMLTRSGVTIADLYSIENYDYEGAWVNTLNFTGFELPIRAFSVLYSTDLLFKRTSMNWKTGVEVSSVQIECRNDPDADTMTTFIPDLLAGYYDNSVFRIYRLFTDSLTLTRDPTLGVFLDIPSSASNAAMIALFCGRLAGVEGDRKSVVLTVNSAMELLNVKMPKNVFTPSCSRTLFLDGCPVSKTYNTWTGTVGAGATRLAVPVVLASPPADGFFNSGSISALDGQPAMIRYWASNVAYLTRELRTIPAAGTAVSLRPGCDKQLTTCQTKFNDSGGVHDFSEYFRGFPWIPVPETAT